MCWLLLLLLHSCIHTRPLLPLAARPFSHSHRNDDDGQWVEWKPLLLLLLLARQVYLYALVHQSEWKFNSAKGFVRSLTSSSRSAGG